MLEIHSDHFENQLIAFIDAALKEDIGTGDVSALACLDSAVISKAQCIVKDHGVIAGVELAGRIFHQFDANIRFTPLVADGDKVAAQTVAFIVEGPQTALLSAERVVLNCMQRMSGIATLTAEVQSLIAHTHCKVLDTRKTTPNFRIAEKWAVQIGGGANHRMGLYDMVMLKDNHIDYCGSVQSAIQKTVEYLDRNARSVLIVVETRNVDEVAACLPYAATVHRILLDNMTTEELSAAVGLIAGRISTEASGGITKENVISIAETGVDFVSMGSIIYDAKVLDMSLKAL
jgi:nicotinate-nucleotide pyrophosphorylase (carboxylating)